MDQINWAPAHCNALRQHRARGMSFAEIAKAINATFKTAYTRNAALGRARRMGLSGPKRPQRAPRLAKKSRLKSKPPRLHKLRERHAAKSKRPAAILAPTVTAKLRSVAIEPRHLRFADLAPGDCRYPYGGDAEGEAITFCGHPQREGSSYCTAHFHLTRGPGAASERAAGAALLRLVAAA
jgi:GcrA cell cycle regulator